MIRQSAKREKSSFFAKLKEVFCWSITLGFVSLLILGMLSKYVHPSSAPFLSFFGLAYPVWAGLNMLLLLFWLYRKRWLLVVLSLVGFLVTFTSLWSIFPIHLSNGDQRHAELSIVSYNVRVFDRYQWSKDELGGQRILSLIEDLDGDIVCMQEYGFSVRNGVGKEQIFQALRHFPYSYTQFDHSSTNINATNKQGLAIFSKYELGNKRVIDVNAHGKSIISCDVYYKGDTVRIFNAHLSSIDLPEVDHSGDIINRWRTEGYKVAEEEVFRIARSFQNAYLARAKQAEKLRKVIDASPYPVFVCGDFNDTPCSYSYAKIKGELRDAYLAKGFGLGSTYRGSYPSSRIDYILHSDEFKTLYFQRVRKGQSDHYPIIASFVRR